MNCPKCQSSMETVSFEGIEIERCTSCYGIWFDEYEEERLKALKGSEVIDTGSVSAQSNTNSSVTNCPKCNVPMTVLTVANQAHIQYEACPVCHGAFFDAGEFKDMKQVTIAEFFKNLLS